MTTTVLICVDGLDPEYLEACEAPNLRRLRREGVYTVGRSMMPSVTNVNNVSILTAQYPSAHGICSNYRLNRDTGQETYVESDEYILAETMFEVASRQGVETVMVTSKDKLRTLLSRSVTTSVSSERPPDWIVEAVGPAPPVYSLEVNVWSISAATFIMSRVDAGIVYISTTDYPMHTFAPDEPESHRNITMLDEAIGELLQAHPDVTLLLTADHGMKPKSRMVDLEGALAKRGITAAAVPIIKDRYVVHHANLGGCMFVHLAARDVDEAAKVMSDIPGVQRVLGAEEASETFRLHPELIGDLVVTGDEDTVFGDPAQVELPPRLRSHGSEHERAVPIFAYNGDFEGFEFTENRDIGRYVFERVLA